MIIIASSTSVLLSAWKYRHERWLRGRTAVTEKKNHTHHYESIIDHHDDDVHSRGREELGVVNENIRLSRRDEYGSMY